MASPYSIDYELTGGSCDQAAGPVNWCMTPSAATSQPMTFDWINVNDANYVGGVTHGDWALQITYPPDWNQGPYLRLHGQEQLMNDTADFPYLLIDVTTYGPAVDPSGAPEGQGPYRQMFSIFNIPNPSDPNSSIFYDSGFDQDIQREIEIADFGEDFSTYTVVVDMTGPAGLPVHGDNKNNMNLTADFYRDQHATTPFENFLWQLVWPFQGRDYPAAAPISLVIDNVRFCDDSLETCLAAEPEGTLGDFNNDGNVDAADYVVWRKFQNTSMTLPNSGGLTGTIGTAHYSLWRENFGESNPGSGGIGVPEPSTLLLTLLCIVLSCAPRPIRR
jgi:hypothetical protein